MANKKLVNKYMRMIDAFNGLRILVVGDVMMDEYVWGNATRISPEAPVPVVEIKSRSYHPGGAANSVSNMMSLGANAQLMGIVGKDVSGRKLREIIRQSGVNTECIITDTSRPTTTKVRIVANGQQVMRADQEENEPVNNRITKKMARTIKKLIGEIDGIAISDYNKGVITPDLMGELINEAREAGKIITADIKPQNLPLFKGVTIITPNRREASGMAGFKIHNDATLKEAGFMIREMLGLEALLITLGSEGMALFHNGGHMLKIPAQATQVYDVTGAGDTVLSVLTLGLAAGFDFSDSVALANYAAGVVVRKRGTTSVDKTELEEFVKTALGTC